MFKEVLLLLSLLLTLSACSSASSTFTKKASQLDFNIIHVQGVNYKHTIYENIVSNKKEILHVYLGGDGTPWFNGRYVTDDPTPLNPVMLHLMKLDKTPSIYLGRPCYHKRKMPVNCDKSLWTSKRYSQIVVDSMLFALNRYINEHNYREISLIGFSGGGAVAMLLASRLQKVNTVVTLAGNLDTDLWASHHGYLPLTGSLNPAKQLPLSPHIHQFHLAGSMDKNVPPFIVESVARKQKNAEYILLKKVDHQCCWLSIWPSMLNKIPM